METTLWILFLLAQNFSFTFVSRARNSGSLTYHVVAAFFSNGIWFVSQLIIVKKFMDVLTKGTWQDAIPIGAIYVVATITGSVLAHKLLLKYEKGKMKVGAR